MLRGVVDRIPRKLKPWVAFGFAITLLGFIVALIPIALLFKLVLVLFGALAGWVFEVIRKNTLK